MAFISYFAIGATVLIAGGVIGYVIWHNLKHQSGKFEKVIINFEPGRTNGHAILKQMWEEETGFGSNPHRHYLPAFPSDNEKGNSEYILNEDDSWTYDNFAPGDLDTHHAMTLTYPRNISRLPQAFKQTAFGQALMLTLTSKQSESDVVAAMKAGGERARDIMEKINTGEFSKELTEKNQRMVQDYSDAVVEKLKKLYPQLETQKKQEVKKEFN